MTRPVVVILLALATMIAAARLRFVHDLPDWDVATYSLVGREMLHGKKLYADIWDMKPPAIFASYAAANAIFKSWDWSAYALAVLTAWATLLGVYFAAAVVDRRAGLWAAALWAAVSMAPALGGVFPNTEAFMNALLAIGFAMVLRATARRHLLIAGVAFALASFYKHVAIAPVVLIASGHILTTPRGARHRAALRSVLILAMIPLGWLLLFGYLAATGRGRLFLDTVFVYPRFYAASGSVELGTIIPRGAAELLPFILLALAAGVPAMLKSRRIAWLWMAYALGAVIAVVLPRRFFDHYYQLLLPPLAIAGGWGASWLWSMRGMVGGRIMPILVLVGTVFLQLHWFLLAPRERAAALHPASFFLDVARDGEEIRQLLRADETFYAWCTEPQLYLIANKRPPAAGLWKLHTTEGPVAPWLTQRTLEDLDRAPPDMIVLWTGYPGPEDHPIHRWIIDHYDPMPDNARRLPLSFFARRGSDLQRRTTSDK